MNAPLERVNLTPASLTEMRRSPVPNMSVREFQNQVIYAYTARIFITFEITLTT